MGFELRQAWRKLESGVVDRHWVAQLAAGTGLSGDLLAYARSRGHTCGDGVGAGAAVVMRKIVSCVLCDEYRRSPQSKLSGVETDRKSTRLNSSHLGISYAVFCLKKNDTTRMVKYLRSQQLTVTNTSGMNRVSTFDLQYNTPREETSIFFFFF